MYMNLVSGESHKTLKNIRNKSTPKMLNVKIEI